MPPMKTVVDKIEALEDGQIQVREATRFYKSGVVLAETFHRHCIAPGDDISKEDPRVQAVALALWTPDVVSAFVAAQAAMEALIP